MNGVGPEKAVIEAERESEIGPPLSMD